MVSPPGTFTPPGVVRPRLDVVADGLGGARSEPRVAGGDRAVLQRDVVLHGERGLEAVVERRGMRRAVAALGTDERQVDAGGLRVGAIGERHVGRLVVAVEHPAVVRGDDVGVVIGAARARIGHLQLDVVRADETAGHAEPHRLRARRHDHARSVGARAPAREGEMPVARRREGRCVNSARRHRGQLERDRRGEAVVPERTRDGLFRRERERRAGGLLLHRRRGGGPEVAADRDHLACRAEQHGGRFAEHLDAFALVGELHQRGAAGKGVDVVHRRRIDLARAHAVERCALPQCRARGVGGRLRCHGLRRGRRAVEPEEGRHAETLFIVRGDRAGERQRLLLRCGGRRCGERVDGRKRARLRCRGEHHAGGQRGRKPETGPRVARNHFSCSLGAVGFPGGPAARFWRRAVREGHVRLAKHIRPGLNSRLSRYDLGIALLGGEYLHDGHARAAARARHDRRVGARVERDAGSPTRAGSPGCEARRLDRRRVRRRSASRRWWR